MTALAGTPEEKLARVQALAEEYLPGVVCELQLYKTQIGCGAIDDRGTLREVQWRLRGLTEFHVESDARALASHFGPRTTMYRPSRA